MAFMSKDGRPSGSKFVARRRDAEAAKSDPTGKEGQMGKEPNTGTGLPSKAPVAAVGDSMLPEESGTHAAMQVAEDHGPATNVHIKSDHAGKKHHVTSMHKDGHVHESDHTTPQDAHANASALGGGSNEAAGATTESAPESDGFTMPSLS